jgi:hypothetical protein
METGIAGIGGIAIAEVGVDAAGGGLAGTVGGFGEGSQAASQATDIASPSSFPSIAFMESLPSRAMAPVKTVPPANSQMPSLDEIHACKIAH